MPAEITWSTERRLLHDAAVERTVDAALEHGGRGGDLLSVVFLDDASIGELHGEWMDDSAPTDVISFDLAGDAGDAGPAGELYVSVEHAERAARDRGLSPERELALYLVHGALHLCGYDDHDPGERRRMRQAESVVLGRLGYPQDPDHLDA